MAPAAFTGTLVFEYQDKTTESFRITASDVAAARWVAPSGAADFQASAAHGGVWIRQVLLSAAGTDCTYSEVYGNDRYVGTNVQHAGNITTCVGRQFEVTPLGPFQPGTRFSFIQRA
jgi:hypothetical protein